MIIAHEQHRPASPTGPNAASAPSGALDRVAMT